MSWNCSDKYHNAIKARKGVFRDTLFVLFFCLALDPCASQAHQPRHRDTLGVGERIWFVENRGQWREPFLFRTQMQRAALFAEEGCLTVNVREAMPHDHHHFHHHTGTRCHAYRVHFEGASEEVSVTGTDIDAASGYDNYYYGHGGERWITNVPHCMTVYYAGLYPGIDMDLRAAGHAVKSNFYIHAGASPAAITLRYEGVDRLYLSDGNLVAATSVGDLVELHPYAYQETATGRREVSVRYRVKENTVSFIVGDYDKGETLVIDPVLIFSTYTGSTADNWGTTATYDSYKNTYTAGLVFEMGYPASVGAYDGTWNGNTDIGIFKFDTTGTQRIFATYLGGSKADMPHSMYVNTFDELVIFGTTGSVDFPVSPDAYDTSFNGGTAIQYENTSLIDFPWGSDIFVSRFSADGTQLQASTYIGGAGNDGLNYRQSYNRNYTIIMQGNDSLYFNYGDGARGELITDDMNNVYVGSTTFSPAFPLTDGCVQSIARGGQEGVVFKLDYNLRNLIWSTFLGGSGDDAIYSIDVDTQYNLLVCGGTNSSNFPTVPGSYRTAYQGGTADGFVAKISYDGHTLMHSSYYGSPEYDQFYFVRTGKRNEVFLFGQTKASGSTLVHNATYNVPGSGMLVVRMTPDLTGCVWSTVFGTPLGRPNLSPTAFAADLCNRVYCAGWGRDFVGYNGMGWGQAGTTGMETTRGAWLDTTDGQDFYVMSIDANATQLDYATFFGELHGINSNGGGDHVDGGTSRFDKTATLYQSVCASCGGYNGFPTTPGVWSDSNHSSNCNNALFRFNIHDDFAVAEFVAPPVGCAAYTVQFHNTGRGTQFLWDFGDGTTSSARNPVHTFAAAGDYQVRLIALMDFGCKSADTIVHTVSVLSNTGRTFAGEASCDGSPIQIGRSPMLGAIYRWTGDVSDSTVANPYVTHSGQYILTIETLGGCSERDTFNVQYINLLDTLIVHNPTCPGGNDGWAEAIVPPKRRDSVSYFWDGLPGDTAMRGLYADGRTHILTLRGYGCELVKGFTIEDPERLTVKKDSHAVQCSDDCDAWVHLVYGYEGLTLEDTLVEALCEGTFIYTFADTAGCPYADTTVIVRSRTLDSLAAWADDTVLFLSESTRLHATRLQGVTYLWDNSHTLDNASSPTPVATPTDTLTLYTVTATDALGCSRNASVTIHCTDVNCGRPNLFIPNAFSPNDDGKNDLLCFAGRFVLEFHLEIFSRWGEKVFETDDIHSCWDGRYDGNWCLPGVYTYVCRVRCEADLETLLKGDITLIR